MIGWRERERDRYYLIDVKASIKLVDVLVYDQAFIFA